MNCKDESTLVSAGDLAKELRRSSYGVKKALKRLGVQPTHTLSGAAYFNRSEAIAKLESSMRSPNITLKS